MAAVRIFLLGAVALLALTVGTVLLMAGSNAGLRFVVANIDPFVPGRLIVVGAAGSLYSGARFERIDYALPDLNLTADDVELRLNWLALVAGEARFSKLYLRRLAISREATAAASSEGLPSFAVPIGLRVVDGRVGELQIENGTFRENLTALTVDAALRGSRLRVFSASGRLRGVRATVDGRLRFAGDWPLDAAVVWEAPDLQNLQGSGTVTGDLRRLQVEQRVTVPEEVAVTATLDNPLDALRYAATVRWETVVRPLGERALTLRQGTISLQGDLANYSAQGSATVAVTDVPTAQLAVAAEGTFERLTLTAIDAQLLDGRLSGTGAVAFGSPQLSLSLDLLASGLNPAAVLPGWSQPVDGRIALTADAAGIVSTALALTAGSNLLSYEGDVAPELRGEFTVQADDLAGLHERARGTLAAAGSVAGSLQQPVADVRVQASDLGWDAVTVAILDARLSSVADGLLQARVFSEGLRAGESSPYNLQLMAAGPLDQFAYRIRGRGANGAAALAGTGSWRDTQLNLRAGTAAVLPPVGPAWALAAPFDLRLLLAGAQAPAATLDAHCWIAQPASLCAESSTFAAAKLSAALTLRELPVAWLVPSGITKVTATGRAGAELQISGDPQQPAARLLWTQRDTQLAGAAADGKPISISLPTVGAELQLQVNTLQIFGEVRADEAFTIAVSGTASELNSAAAPLALNIVAAVDDIAIAGRLLEPLTGLRDITGQASANFDVGGTVAQPTLAGEARLVGASADWPLTGITLRELSLTARGSGRQRVALAGSARSGEGAVELAGDLNWLGEQLAAQVQLSGQDFEALRFPGQIVRVSPNLKLIAQGTEIAVTGALAVPYADITIERLPESAVKRSDDVVVVRAASDDPATSRPLRVSTDIEVKLGQDVRLRAFGLDTRLAGAVNLTMPTGAVEPALEGNLRSVDGNFEAYGREFRIERGVLIFSGVADNPAVNVRAVRELRYDGQDIKIGVQLSGTLDQIQTRLFGEPAMSESDALAYLVLNRPMQRSDSLASEELSGAAVALGMANMLPVSEQLRDTLGLDEIEFSGMTRESSTVTAGKRLSDDFYVRYSYGLFERIGRFVIRYSIGRGFSLEAGSGQEQTIDVLYTVDR